VALKLRADGSARAGYTDDLRKINLFNMIRSQAIIMGMRSDGIVKARDIRNQILLELLRV
jgi:hypothetical protein